MQRLRGNLLPLCALVGRILCVFHAGTANLPTSRSLQIREADRGLSTHFHLHVFFSLEQLPIRGIVYLHQMRRVLL